MLKSFALSLLVGGAALPALAAPIDSFQADYVFDEMGGHHISMLAVTAAPTCDSHCGMLEMVFNYVSMRFVVGSTYGGSDLLDIVVDSTSRDTNNLFTLTDFMAPSQFYLRLVLTAGTMDEFRGIFPLAMDWKDEIDYPNYAYEGGIEASAPPVAAVPLPAGLVLLASGLGGLGLMRRKRG